MVQPSLFDHHWNGPPAKPESDQVVRLRLLVTVQATPVPSERYGETVCVAGVNLDLVNPGWIRLYPINFRALSTDETFRKYDVVTVAAIPARQDPRGESWRPQLDSISTESHLKDWAARRKWLDPYVVGSMCKLNRDARDNPHASSLALIRPREVSALEISHHPGWTPDEQRKMDRYAQQPDLFGGPDKTPLQAPRFRAAYRYRCHDPLCRGHRQGLLDWEFVALQRRLLRAPSAPDEAVVAQLRENFLDKMCPPSREVAFYVGNQAKRPHVFSVLGVYYPPR